MKLLKTLSTLIALLLISTVLLAGKDKVQFSTSEPDANIYVNGQLAGKGQVEVIVLNKSCITVRVEKVGFLTDQIEFCNKKTAPKVPKTYYLEMKRDDAFDASVQSDIANVDIELPTDIPEEDAWRLMSQIVTNYFDIIEVTDKETGYLRTSWVAQSFKQNTIRTRLIIKLGSTSPLTYKAKLVSEQSRNASTSIKSDELFRSWDRVLRKYSNVITELQSRL